MHHDLPAPARDLVVSYRALRRAIGTVGLFLPLVLGPGGLLVGVEIQDTMSDYYHTALRDAFVGALFALGVLLLCYRGYNRIESWTANTAAAAAICLAVFPLDDGSDPLVPRTLQGYLHTLSGGVFFVVLSVYSLYHFPRSSDDELDRVRRLIYRTTGIVLLTTVVLMGGLIFFVRGENRVFVNRYNVMFWLEWLAVWAFATAWLTKGRAIVTEIGAALLSWPMSVLDQLRSRNGA